MIMKISDEKLFEYAFGELPDNEIDKVREYIVQNPSALKKVNQYRFMKQNLKDVPIEESLAEVASQEKAVDKKTPISSYIPSDKKRWSFKTHIPGILTGGMATTAAALLIFFLYITNVNRMIVAQKEANEILETKISQLQEKNLQTEEAFMKVRNELAKIDSSLVASNINIGSTGNLEMIESERTKLKQLQQVMALLGQGKELTEIKKHDLEVNVAAQIKSEKDLVSLKRELDKLNQIMLDKQTLTEEYAVFRKKNISLNNYNARVVTGWVFDPKNIDYPYKQYCYVDYKDNQTIKLLKKEGKSMPTNYTYDPILSKEDTLKAKSLCAFFD